MASKENPRFPELREFIKEHDQRVYDFCTYLLPPGSDRDDLVLAVFRDFGDYYRRASLQKDSSWEPLEVRIRLFQLAWDRVREMTLQFPVPWSAGRDTRQLKGMDEDLLKASKAKTQNPKNLIDPLREHLSRLDVEYRAPLVLRDILHFEDEEVMRILGLRWGVYRHRLHRGRLELKDSLRGKLGAAETKGVTLAFQPNPN